MANPTGKKICRVALDEGKRGELEAVAEGKEAAYGRRHRAAHPVPGHGAGQPTSPDIAEMPPPIRGSGRSRAVRRLRTLRLAVGYTATVGRLYSAEKGA